MHLHTYIYVTRHKTWIVLVKSSTSGTSSVGNIVVRYHDVAFYTKPLPLARSRDIGTE